MVNVFIRHVDYDINSKWSELRSTIGDNDIAMKNKEEYVIFFRKDHSLFIG